MFEHHKKESPVFTGIARGVGGFGFGKSSAAVGGGAIGGFGFLAAAAGPGSGTGYYEVIIDGAGTTGTTFTFANAYLWATSDTVAVQWLTNHGFVVSSPSNARQVTTSRTNFTINASSVPSAAKVIAFGAGGGHRPSVTQPTEGESTNASSEGGAIHLTSGFTPGSYKVVIGQGGYQSDGPSVNPGGYGGGGIGYMNRSGTDGFGGGGGGLTGLYQSSWPGAFNVPQSITSAYLVAGGGGGSGYTSGMSSGPVRNSTRTSNGGPGGYPRGDDGSLYPGDAGGLGGTQSAAGVGGAGRLATGGSGSFSQGGGGAGSSSSAPGGGGGGYYGGGGGSDYVGAGGGGSSFAPAPSTKTGYYGWNPVGGWGINGKGTVRGVTGNAIKFGSTQYNDPDSQGAGGLLYIYV